MRDNHHADYPNKDLNDMAASLGLAAVRRQIEEALQMG